MRCSLALLALLALVAAAPAAPALSLLDDGAVPEWRAAPGGEAAWNRTVRLQGSGAAGVEVALTPAPAFGVARLVTPDGRAGPERLLANGSALLTVPEGASCWHGWCGVYRLEVAFRAPETPGGHRVTLAAAEAGEATAGLLVTRTLLVEAPPLEEAESAAAAVPAPAAPPGSAPTLLGPLSWALGGGAGAVLLTQGLRRGAR